MSPPLDLPDHGGEWSQEDLMKIVAAMREVSNRTYDVFFWGNMGAYAHAFIEFNGLLSKYVDICQRAAEQGIDFTDANVHSGIPFPVEEHDMNYLGEKLQCIFGPMINANPRARAALKRALFDE